MRKASFWIGLMAMTGLVSCGSVDTLRKELVSRDSADQSFSMGWDHRPEADQWTQVTMNALQQHGANLPAMVPGDIETWCPHYPEASNVERRAFWTGLLSALAKFESTWNPQAVGGGGLWIGLVQIDPRTAKGHGCEAQTVAALKDGAANLRCAVRIAAHQVPRRGGTVSSGMRDWGPFHHDYSRSDMASWTRSQPYCASKS